MALLCTCVFRTPQEKDRGEEDIVDSDMARANMVVNEEKLKVDLTRYAWVLNEGIG